MDITSYFLCCLLLALATILFICYMYIKSIYNYWKERDIPYIEPSFPFGNLGDVIMGRKSLIDLTIEQYRQFEGERFFGIFNLNKPALVIRDPSLIEQILITDFTSFCDKVEESSECTDFLSNYLGNIKGNAWRQLRHKLNGAFSYSKLKQMTEQISMCADSFIEKISEYESKKEVAFADCLGFLFAQSVIASCVFGIQYDSIGTKSFIQNVKKCFLKMKVVHLILLWNTYIPSFSRILYFLPPVSKVVDYFKHLTSASIELRQQSKVKRKDFLQILIDLQEEEKATNHMGPKNKREGIETSKQLQNVPSDKEHFISDNFIVSTLFIFMSLGMESSAIAICFLLYDLASNPSIQRKVQQEVDAAVNKFGELNYEALQQLNYLDSVIQESVRIKPGFAYITRVCTAPYKLSGSDVVLEKGVRVLIPTCAVHLDPQNYADPDYFNPDRFTDNHYKPSPIFLTFGAGPRMCIAVKLVILELKLAIVKVMLKYSVTLNSKTEVPIRYAPQFMPKLLNGIWIEFESRASN